MVPDKAIFKSDFGCCAYAVVELTAGMVKSKEASFVHSDALEGIWDSPSTLIEFKPDTWARSSLILSRDVMLDLSKSIQPRLLPRTISVNYVKILIRQSPSRPYVLCRAMLLFSGCILPSLERSQRVGQSCREECLHQVVLGRGLA